MTLGELCRQTGVPLHEARRAIRGAIPRAGKIGAGYKIKGSDNIAAVRAILLGAKRPPHPPAMPAALPKPETPELPFGEPVTAAAAPAEGMTLLQIAELCKVGASTIRDWIRGGEERAESAQDRATFAGVSAKLAEAQTAKKPARFVEAEVLAIVRAGGRGHEADLLAGSSTSKPAAPALPAPRASRLPSGAQLRELRLMGEKRILSAGQIQDLLGVRERVALGAGVAALGLEPPKAAPEVAEAAFGALN